MSGLRRMVASRPIQEEEQQKRRAASGHHTRESGKCARLNLHCSYAELLRGNVNRCVTEGKVKG